MLATRSMRPISNVVPGAYRATDASCVRNVEMTGPGMPGCVAMPSTISWLRSTERGLMGASSLHILALPRREMAGHGGG